MDAASSVVSDRNTGDIKSPFSIVRSSEPEGAGDGRPAPTADIADLSTAACSQPPTGAARGSKTKAWALGLCLAGAAATGAILTQGTPHWFPNAHTSSVVAEFDRLKQEVANRGTPTDCHPERTSHVEPRSLKSCERKTLIEPVGQNYRVLQHTQYFFDGMKLDELGLVYTSVPITDARQLEQMEENGTPGMVLGVHYERVAFTDEHPTDNIRKKITDGPAGYGTHHQLEVNATSGAVRDEFSVAYNPDTPQQQKILARESIAR